MKYYIIYLIYFSISFCIGVQGIQIPENSYILSTSGTGIASGNTPGLNPALSNNNTFIQFSLNNWLSDIDGSHTSIKWGKNILQYLSIQTWGVDNIQLRGEQPTTEPLGNFSVNFLSIAYSISHNLNTPLNFGARLKANYSHLFIKSMKGLTIDLGARYKINNYLASGIVLKNLGYEYFNQEKVELPQEVGLGLQFNIAPISIFLLTDIAHIKNRGLEKRIGIKTDYKLINIHTGITMNEGRNGQAFGLSFKIKKWLITYSLYKHENSILGFPTFLDIRLYL